MARIKMGSIVTDIRGKLGGHSFQKGNQSRVLKTGGSPRQNFTSLRNSQQLLVNQTRSLWRALTSTERREWRSSASLYPFKNVFNDVLVLNGFQFYMKLQMNLLRAGHTATLSPTALFPSVAYFYLTTANIDWGAQTFEQVGVGLGGTARYVMLSAIGSQLGGVPNISKFTYLRNGSVETITSPSNIGILNAKYGQIYNGMPIFLAVYQVNTSGFASTPFIIRVTYS